MADSHFLLVVFKRRCGSLLATNFPVYHLVVKPHHAKLRIPFFVVGFLIEIVFELSGILAVTLHLIV